MTDLQRREDGTWNVECCVCGHQLGSNKDLCGKGKKKSNRPPCVWAESDSTFVTKCYNLQQKRLATVQSTSPQEHFEIGSRVYVREVQRVGTIRALAWNSGRSFLHGYAVQYESVEDGEDAEGDHTTVEVYRLLDSAATWPEAAAELSYMSTVIGQQGVRSGSQVKKLVGSLVHACVDLQGLVHYYGVARSESEAVQRAVFYFHASTVTQHNARSADKTGAQLNATSQSAKNAAAEKERKAEEDTAQARRRLEAGWTPDFSEETAEQNAHASKNSEEPKGHTSPTFEQLHSRMESLKATEAQAQQAAGAATTDATGQEDSKNTNWTHEAKVMFYGWVASLNPFKAARGETEAAWDEVAARVAESSKHLTKKNGRIDLNGSALRVYLSKQMSDTSGFGSYKKRLREEATTSGQAGTLNSHLTKEYSDLEKIEAMKKDAQEDSANLKDDKALLKGIKDNQMLLERITTSNNKNLQLFFRLLRLLLSKHSAQQE